MGLSAAQRQKDFRKNSPDKAIAAQKRYRDKRREFLDSLKSTPCTDCGISYPPYVMDFDHLPGTEKKFHIGQRLNRTLDEVLEEIEKCEVVCSNCHRLRTHNRKNGD